MKLSPNDIYMLCQCAVSAAHQAGAMISRYRQEEIRVNRKAGMSLASSVVTKVDLLSQEAVLKTLRPTCDFYDLALLSEEEADDLSRRKKDFFWCVDPLDGTLPFIEKKPGYSVSIALISKEGIPHIGVIYDPEINTLYTAIKGCGATRNGAIWKHTCPQSSRKLKLTTIFDRSTKEETRFQATLDALETFAASLGLGGLNVPDYGGAAMNACWVLENGPACYLKYPRTVDSGGSLWDYGASACIFNEMGAVATDVYGSALDLNRESSTYMNHRGLIFASNNEIAKGVSALMQDIAADDSIEGRRRSVE